MKAYGVSSSAAHWLKSTEVAVTLPVVPLGPLNAKHAAKTSVPTGCSTSTRASVNLKSVIVSVQFGFGQSGAPAIGEVGGRVVTENEVVPFLISVLGIGSWPATVAGAGFCPGGWVAPAGFVQTAVACAEANSSTRMSPLPSPARKPDEVNVSPLSKKDGVLFGGLRWTFCANAAVPRRTQQRTVLAFMKHFIGYSSSEVLLMQTVS